MFTWDEDKRQANLEFRKVDFIDAIAIFNDPEIIEAVDGRNDYGEERIRALGQVDGSLSKFNTKQAVLESRYLA